MRQVPNSELRHRILTALSHESASSVTALAQRLEALRPSVSRAVNSLLEAGLVTRQGRTLILNEVGQQELKRLDAALTSRIRKSTDVATRILAQTIPTGKQMQALINSPRMRDILIPDTSLIRQAMKALDSGIIQQARQAYDIGSALSDLGAFDTGAIQQALNALDTSYVQHSLEAINATAHIQTINLDLLRTWDQTISGHLNHLVLENNAFLSSMMVDLEAIAKLGAMVDHSVEDLINQTAWTTKAYDAYFTGMVSRFGQFPTIKHLETVLTIPTTGVASLIGSARDVVESHIISQTELKLNNTTRVSIHTERFTVVSIQLESYLKPLGERFINKWEGAWQTLYSDSKDRFSQATHSGRELLMQVLAHLAPDEAFSKEDCIKHNVDKPSRKMRIKYILGNDNHNQSTVELINGMADTLDNMYRVLVGEAHRRDDKHQLDATIEAQLAALGSLLTMLLSMRDNTQS